MSETIDRKATVLVTGSRGMIGSSIHRLLKKHSCERILAPSRHELNLSDPQQVDTYFGRHHPYYVFMIAAKVGGILANESDPVGFLKENLHIQLNLFEACHKYRVRKTLFLGSSCVYPRECPQPMKEEFLMSGALEPTNEAYAIAKIAGLKLAKYSYLQFGMVTICPMPCNVYGTNDTFSLDRAHVLSALVRRLVDAYDEELPYVTLLGTGMARREFIHVDDVAEALLLLMEKYNTPEIINVGTGKDIAIKDLATLVARIVGYKGEIRWDRSKPDGMPRKCLDISRIAAMGFQARINLAEGIQRTVQEYRELKARGKLYE